MTRGPYKRVLLKLSGESLCRKGGFGIDGEEVGWIGREVREVVNLGVQLAIVVGGGNIVRGKDLMGKLDIEPATAHYMGMLGTVINALAVQDALESMGLQTRVQSAISVEQCCERFIRRRCIRHLEKGRVVVLAAGTGNPFVTTDTCAALRATEIGAEVVLKATKVDGVYDADPMKESSAQRYEKLSYNQVIDHRLQVMDVSAIDLCQQNHIPIVVFNFRKEGNMRRVVAGEPIGTLISE